MRRYPVFRAAVSTFAWLPIFFLLFRESLSFEHVLQLEAIYYFTVVLLEVPSGWFSDRIGRVVTLRIGVASLVASYALFALADGFVSFAAAQCLLGFGMAMQSGTDTSYHFDALRVLGRTDEYAQREARAERAAFLMTALTAVVGGALGFLSLRLAYLVSGIGASAAFLLLLSFPEPRAGARAGGALAQLVRVVRSLVDRELRWCFAFAVCLYTVVHVPYEFYQPWLDELLRQGAPALPRDWAVARATPFYSGLIFGGTSLLSAFVAGRSALWAERFGSRRAMLAALAVASTVCAAMGAAVHAAFIAFILLRSVSSALAMAPLRARIAPRVESTMRATWLSVQALVSRFVFGLGLLGLAHVARAGYAVPDGTPEALAELLGPLRVSAIFGAACCVLLAVLARRPRRLQ